MGHGDGQTGGRATWQGSATLEKLGVHPRDEGLYRALLRRPRRTVEELAAELGRTLPTVRRGLRRLEELGLVTRTVGSPGRLIPTRPDVAVDVLVARRQQELVHAQAAARSLLDEIPVERRHQPDELIEVLVGREAVATRFAQLESTVQHELLVLDRPPYSQPVSDANASELDLLRRGVTVRGIYAPESLEVDGHLELLQVVVAAGEDARIHASVPMKLAVADREVALLPLSLEQNAEQALVVHGSSLLTALVALFEVLWELAIPLPSHLEAVDQQQTAAGPIDSDLATMLTSGLTDQAVARRLGISQRTLHRRIRTLMRSLGAQTRFQAGLKVGHLVASGTETEPPPGPVESTQR